MNLVPRVFSSDFQRAFASKSDLEWPSLAERMTSAFQYTMGIIRNDNENKQFELELGVFCKVVSGIHLTNYFLFKALVIFAHEQSGEINYSLSIL